MRTTLEISRLTYTQARHDTYKSTNIMPMMTTYLCASTLYVNLIVFDIVMLKPKINTRYSFYNK